MAQVGSIMRGSGYKGRDNPDKNMESLAVGSKEHRTEFFALKLMNENPGLGFEAAKKSVEKYGYGNYK
ncbi:MAG: hypothetical protein V1728_03555 [Candidatus Micrarchaeota archaeon]